MSVRVTFTYEPDDPDDDDPTGVSEAEHQELMDHLLALGAEDVEISKQD